jgi:hypothetical protein
MDKKIFFIILIIFILTSDFYFVIRNIIKYGLYLILIIYLIKMINPKLSEQIKKIINGFISSDENIIFKYISYFIKYIKKYMNNNKIPDPSLNMINDIK